MPDTKKAPNDKPITTGLEGEGIPDSVLHSEDKRNNPDGELRLGGNSKGFPAGKEPGGKR